MKQWSIGAVAAIAVLLSACANDNFTKPDDGRGEGNPGHEGKPGENKLMLSGRSVEIRTSS